MRPVSVWGIEMAIYIKASAWKSCYQLLEAERVGLIVVGTDPAIASQVLTEEGCEWWGAPAAAFGVLTDGDGSRALCGFWPDAGGGETDKAT